MKYLSHYVEAKQTLLFERTGAFFAFSKSQLEDGSKGRPKADFVSLGGGLLAPKENVKDLVNGLSEINSEGIAADIAENGKPAIIQRELGNYETQLSGDMSETVEALVDYDISEADIKKEYPAFYQNCLDNDYF